MQLIDEVEKAQVLLDKCVYASAVPNVNSKTDGSDGRRILGEEVGTGKLNHPPARPPFGCVVSPHLFLFCLSIRSICMCLYICHSCLFHMQTYGYYLSYFWANDKRTREALGIKKVSYSDQGDISTSRVHFDASAEIVRYHELIREL